GGWAPGGRYLVLVDGVTTAEGALFQPDAVMTWLRDTAPLDDPSHERAFPGATRDERLAAGARLERVRADLDGWIAAIGADRGTIAAATAFTVTTRAEIAFDRDSQRVPLPFDVLIDPATGKVDLTPADWDTPLEAEAKRVANTLDGFGLSSNPFFEVTAGLDVASARADTIQLWDVSATPTRVPVDIDVMTEDGPCRRPPWDAACRHVFLRLPPDQIPLRPATTYAVVVTRGLLDQAGRPVVPQPLGALVGLDAAVLIDERSQIAAVDDANARKVERARREVDALLDRLGRDTVAAAWPFTTMDPVPGIRAAAHRAEDMGLDASPRVSWRRPASSLLSDDALSDLFPGSLNPAPPLYGGRVDGVRQVIAGTLPAPDWLDDTTRREVGEPTIEDLPFWAMTPEGYSADRRLPVLVFGHAIVTDRRFQLMIASELVQRGFVVVSVDFPYHGLRTSCVESSLVAIPNFFPPALQPVVGFSDDLIWLPPCASGDAASCGPRGACLDARGRPEPFTTFPVIDLRSASGAAFLDTADIPHIPDHFRQALTDLSTLVHSLRTADWERALDQRIDPDQIYYAGQSLGSIIGTVWVATRDDVPRAVFNVPGSNLVDLFMNSTYFQPQMSQLFVDLGVPDGSYEQERLLQVASWLVDTVDPHAVAHLYAERGFPGLIQMDKIDADTGDLIIPNFTTENLQRVSGMPMRTYPSALHADLLVPGLGDAMLRDMGAHLGGIPK
ncbi:MAG TPA: hypothetical protein PKA64_19870, partial [Myxococcota bacterium]|nr:hypothetical protein [Myxococcota bacterium]